MVRVAEKKCNMGKAQTLLCQIFRRVLLPQVFNDACKRYVEFAQPPHQRTLAHAQLRRNDFCSTLSRGKQFGQTSLNSMDQLLSVLRPLLQ